jgi:hypothetical protein
MPVYTAVNPLEALSPNATNTNGYQFSYLTYPREFDDVSSFGHYMNFYINVNRSSKYLSGSTYSTTPQQATGNYATTYVPAWGSSLPGYQTTTAPTLGGMSGVPIDIMGQLSSFVGGAIGGGVMTGIGLASGAAGAAGAAVLGAGGILGSLGGATNWNGQGSSFSTGMLGAIPYTRITQAISLYIPDSMSFSSGYDWQEASLTDAGGKALKFGQLAGGAYNATTDDVSRNNRAMEGMRHVGAELIDIMAGAGGAGNGLGDIGLGIAGLAVNPQIFVLFRGVDLRTFQFDFIFTPKSPEEAANVRNIIKAFRFHAAPEIDPYTGRYFIAPSTFNIEYMYAPAGSSFGSRNNNIFNMMTLVLQKINVDYAPYGWSTYDDGMPIQTQLSMVFKETEILTKEKINQGY